MALFSFASHVSDRTHYGLDARMCVALMGFGSEDAGTEHVRCGAETDCLVGLSDCGLLYFAV